MLNYHTLFKIILKIILLMRLQSLLRVLQRGSLLAITQCKSMFLSLRALAKQSQL